jgi:hypothetical protein
MKPRLEAQAVAVLQGLSRSPEGQYLREMILRPWLAAVDQTLRRASDGEFQRRQGEAGALEHLIDLLSNKPPATKTRRLVVDGEAREFRVSDQASTLGRLAG